MSMTGYEGMRIKISSILVPSSCISGGSSMPTSLLSSPIEFGSKLKVDGGGFLLPGPI